MKKILEKHAVFMATLRALSLIGKRKTFNRLTLALTTLLAKLNIRLNKPTKSDSVEDLAQTWKALMPRDGQEHFKITRVEDDVAYAEIHLHCPLRGTGNREACHQLMNYDRKLMEHVGGELTVLESQSNSGKPYCCLSIKKRS